MPYCVLKIPINIICKQQYLFHSGNWILVPFCHYKVIFGHKSHAKDIYCIYLHKKMIFLCKKNSCGMYILW